MALRLGALVNGRWEEGWVRILRFRASGFKMQPVKRKGEKDVVNHVTNKNCQQRVD